MTIGKRKGSGWERDLSRQLSHWWTHGKDENVFWRSVGSGGFFKTKKDIGLQGQSGDIVALKPEGEPFINAVSIEAKFYKSENSLLFEVLGEKRTQVLQWWQQCEDDALDARKIPILIVKFNRQSPFMMIPDYLYRRIEERYGALARKTKMMIDIRFDGSVFNKVHIIKFEEFLTWCHPNFFKERLNGI
jgi:hypothetical protein